jgi:hypothetical protein
MTEIADLPERQLTSTPLVELTLHDNNPRTHSKKQIARIADSITRFAHDSGIDRFLLDLRTGVHDDLRNELMEQRLERFIGVIYRSETSVGAITPLPACPPSSTPLCGSTKPAPLRPSQHRKLRITRELRRHILSDCARTHG